MSEQQQGESGHVSVSCESNSRGRTYSVKVVAPIGASASEVQAARELAQAQLLLGMEWLDARFGPGDLTAQLEASVAKAGGAG